MSSRKRLERKELKRLARKEKDSLHGNAKLHH